MLKNQKTIEFNLYEAIFIKSMVGGRIRKNTIRSSAVFRRNIQVNATEVQIPLIFTE